MTQAGPHDARQVLEALWNCPTCSGDCGSANPPPIFCPTDRFRKLLDAGAYLSAAEMLVPDGMVLEALRAWPGHPAKCSLWGTHEENGERWHNFSDGRFEAEGPTPALALAAAISAALASREG